jgi:hypothetical protein
LPVDPKALPGDPETLQKIIVDLTAQLDRTERLLRQLLEAKTGRKSEQLSREQLALFAEEAGISLPEPEDSAEIQNLRRTLVHQGRALPADGSRCPNI